MIRSEPLISLYLLGSNQLCVGRCVNAPPTTTSCLPLPRRARTPCCVLRAEDHGWLCDGRSGRREVHTKCEASQVYVIQCIGLVIKSSRVSLASRMNFFSSGSVCTSLGHLRVLGVNSFWRPVGAQCIHMVRVVGASGMKFRCRLLAVHVCAHISLLLLVSLMLLACATHTATSFSLLALRQDLMLCLFSCPTQASSAWEEPAIFGPSSILG